MSVDCTILNWYRARLCNALRVFLGMGFFAIGLTPSLAQVNKPAAPKAEDPYRQFMKKPETAQEFWAAMRFEIEVGKFNLAAEDLKGFLAKKPTDEDLLEIEKREGMSAFLRLLTIKDLREDAK